MGLALNMDVLPTAMSLVGVHSTSNQALDLKAQLENDKSPGRKYLLSEFHGLRFLYSQRMLVSDDGWMFNDPRTRTHRSPSLSTPVTPEQDIPVSKTNEAYITEIAENMIRSRLPGVPFFQVCCYNGPHPPFMVPAPYYNLYDPQSVVESPNFGPHPDEPAVNRNSYYRQLFNDHGTTFDAWRKSYAVYWGFVSMIDTMIGRLLTILETERVLDDTVVVFVSDHGENIGAHGL